MKRIITLTRGNHVSVTCDCGYGLQIIVRRPRKGNTYRFICEECGFDQTYRWSRLTLVPPSAAQPLSEDD